jgi:ParB family chromosome partitioning protein
MPLGKGLSSLIPPKNEKDQNSFQNSNLNFIHQSNQPSSTFENLNPKAKDLKEKNPKNKLEEAVFQIEIEKISSNPYQPRKEFDENSLLELAESIKQIGILQPLVVSKIVEEKENGTNVRYELIAGERRLRAAKIAGLEKVPVIIKTLEKPGHNLEMALIENIQRSDLNPIEEAKAYSKLQDEFGLTQREIALKVGKSREAVANSLRLLNLPEKIQNALIEEKITESQARMLLSLEGEERERVFENLLTQKLSVRHTQNIIAQTKKQTLKSEFVSPQLIFLQKKLEEKFNLPIKIKDFNGKKGKIVIEFYSLEDLQNLIDQINQQE